MDHHVHIPVQTHRHVTVEKRMQRTAPTPQMLKSGGGTIGLGHVLGPEIGMACFVILVTSVIVTRIIVVIVIIHILAIIIITIIIIIIFFFLLLLFPLHLTTLQNLLYVSNSQNLFAHDGMCCKSSPSFSLGVV